MSAVFYLIGSTIMFIVGYVLGNKAGWREGHQNGLFKGAEITLKEIEKTLGSGLKSTLDWETTERLLKERLSRN